MSLDHLLQRTVDLGGGQVSSITEERLRAILIPARQLISYFREYPDYFVDFIKGEDSTFKFFFYQRIFLRIVMRHKYTYSTFPRAFSKSFLSMMTLIIRSILYPGCEFFVTTGGKEQAASITVAKVEEICRLIPALHNEIKWERGESKKSKDSVEYIFKSGSKINILAAKESSRGQRRTGRNKINYCVGQKSVKLNIDRKRVGRIINKQTYKEMVEDWERRNPQ